MPGYWLVKSEPTTFSFERLVAEGHTLWDGVRNYQARNHLKGMKVGDNVLFYHSVKGMEVVGTATVKQEFFPEPGDDTGKWVVVELIPGSRLKQPVSLETIKNTPSLANIGLVKQGRLSVMPLTKSEFDTLIKLGKGLSAL